MNFLNNHNTKKLKINNFAFFFYFISFLLIQTSKIDNCNAF